MTEHTDGADTDSDHDDERIDFDAVRAIEAGEAIVVQAVTESDRFSILAGRVDTISADPADAVEDAKQDTPTDSDTTVCVSTVHLDASVWWVIDDGELTDMSDRLDDRPPVRVHYDLPLKEPPSVALAPRNDGTVSLIVPMPEMSGSRARSYYPTDRGAVVELRTGPLVSPTELLPSDCSPPD